MKHPKVRNRKVRITVEFPSAEAADAWLSLAKLSGHFPKDAWAWPMDALDRMASVKEYLVRRSTESRIGTPIKGTAVSAEAAFDQG